MSLQNPSFEQPGDAPGEATGWSHVEVSSTKMVVFSTTDAEDFAEGWWEGEYRDTVVFVTDTVPALFNTSFSSGQPMEDFNGGWRGNQNYRVSFSGGSSAGVESFSDWGDSSMVPRPGIAAFFGTPELYGDNAEDFEEGWLDNVHYRYVRPPSTAAVFGAGSEEVEKFGPIYPDLQVVAQANPANFFTPIPPGTPNGLEFTWLVTFVLGETGRLPGGLSDGLEYYVLAADGPEHTFQISLSPAGEVVQLTDTGAGAFYVRGDPGRFWLQRVDGIE